MSNRYYYASTISEFLVEDQNSILGCLADSNKFDLTLEQKSAWNTQISLLQETLAPLDTGHLYFEYAIPRMGKRCDAVLLFKDTIFVLEFKAGAKNYHSADIRQTVDYALDLKNFHKESHTRRIVPILISTDAQQITNELEFADDQIANCQLTNGADLLEIINSLKFSDSYITPSSWESSPYQPTPTIIEAAQYLYQNHEVSDISRSDASAKNLTETSESITKIIEESKKHSLKSICFITGVPGAGKTLAGLNIATSILDSEDGSHATFLSGNGPLVAVLQRSLAEDKKEREGITLENAKRETKTFVQNIHHFRDDYIQDPNAPSEHVVIFDEAQRAWTKDKATKFMKSKKGIEDFDQSEPQFLIDVMGRHSDWCVVIALVGGGQEINDGEAGLPEWFKAIKESKHNWKTFYSSNIDKPEYLMDHTLQELLPADSKSKTDLHLAVGLRSFRSEQLSTFINALISGDHILAKSLASNVTQEYPFYFTSDITKAKQWVKTMSRGSERYGLVASANAKRLSPYGIQMKINIEPEHWFLKDSEDIRSSNFLELTASQYDVQGLELDWAIVGWDADLRRKGDNWDHFSFKGSNWQKINKPIDQLYLKNAYRVILTRARQGMIIFLPEGDTEDKTRLPEFYKPIKEYLLSCGIEELKGNVSAV